MRAELPWNVAGIPPEAREAARAAARREGLSVGEWLTRHIMRSFSGFDDAAGLEPPLAAVPPDSWAVSATARRDSEDMLARVGRSENESVDAWRRIEEQLRGIGRRLDSNEHSHSESNRFLSRTAQEMNVNAREQAEAFGQLGENVRNLRERLERLERSATNDNIREAIKALHLGLSRLADQLTATAGNSAGQLAQVTANLEKLAAHVGKIWEDADNTAQLLNQRIDLTQSEFAQRLQESERGLDARLSAAEKITQFNTNALDHALEKIETAAAEHEAELAEDQRRAAAREESLRLLQDSFAELEGRLPGIRLETRLNTIERSIGGLKETVTQRDPGLIFGVAVQDLSQRLERLERDHGELIEALRPVPVEQKLEPVSDIPFETAQPSIEAEQDICGQEEAAVPTAMQEPPALFAPEPGETIQGPEIEDGEMLFAARDPAFGPQDAQDDDIAFTDVVVEPEPDDLLVQARLSAQAAADRAESERLIRLSAFHTDAGREERTRPRYLVPALAACLVVMFTVAALVMSERARTLGEQLAATNPVSDKVPVLPALPGGKETAPTPDNSASGPENDQTAEIADTPRNALQTASDAAQTQASKPASLAPDAPKPPKTIASAGGDRVVQLASSGNPVALAILGLKALDGTGGTAIDLPNAVKFLTQAADKGQAVAEYRLGTLYERGQGVASDPVKAMHWYELAASQGNRKAMHNLAVAYASGQKRNMTEAARWFAKAAALGLADSQFNLAVLYERGEGVPQSLADAYKWYAVAALSGDAEAKARKGVLETQLSESDRTAANRSAAGFRASPLIRSVNVPPEPADLGT